MLICNILCCHHNIIIPLANEIVTIDLMQGSEEINSNSGLSFVKRLLGGNARMKDWDAELPEAANSCYPTSAIVRSTIGLMTAGNSSYADIEKFRYDFLFRRLAGGSVPSQETLRQRLDALAGLAAHSRRKRQRPAVANPAHAD